MTVRYEWDIETWDAESGDVLEHDHRERLDQFDPDRLREALKGKGTLRLVLVRDVGDEHHGVTDRTWAYVEDGKLPGIFRMWFDADSDDSAGETVPVRFVAELERHT